MKKSSLFFMISFLMIAASTKAQNTLNNPKDEEGFYIVKWDCLQNDFAASNDIEADETFTFAVDVTGTAWEDWLKETPTNEGATRALAINKWTGFGNFRDGTNRLKQISGNIYGATWNMVQMANTLNVDTATQTDVVTFVLGQVFGFEYTETNPGAGWWMWPESIPEATNIDPGTESGAIFKTLPYTGEKTGDEFYSDDYEGGLFLSNNQPEMGYTIPCAGITPTIEPNVLNNPKDEDGFYIVRWDCATNAFAASNDIEADETFTFAVDVTGTNWEAWLAETPTAEGATRALAINKWTGFGNFREGTNRLQQISENIYGATWNMVQMANTMNVDTATQTDVVTFVLGQVFGYEFTETSAGAGWWMWPESVAEGTNIDPGTESGAIFKTVPYTGEKTGDEFYSDDYEGGLFLSNNTPEKGYSVPCGELIPTGINDVDGTDAKVIGHEYYNIMGQRLRREPTTGMYIHKMLKADGTYVVIKKFNLREQ